MGQLLLILAVALVVGVIVFGLAVLITGSDTALEPAEPDGREVPLPTHRPLSEADLSRVRFDLALRGYRMAQVDQALRRAAYDIGYKDELIDVLEAEVSALRHGRLEDAEALRRAREAARAGTTEAAGEAARAGTTEEAGPASAAAPGEADRVPPAVLPPRHGPLADLVPGAPVPGVSPPAPPGPAPADAVPRPADTGPADTGREDAVAGGSSAAADSHGGAGTDLASAPPDRATGGAREVAVPDGDRPASGGASAEQALDGSAPVDEEDAVSGRRG